MSVRFRPPIENPATATAAVKLLLDSAVAPKLAMQGTSMLPLLREPMVLELAPIGDKPLVGDVVVFETDGKLVAHRVTSLRAGRLQTCGDARPWAPEYPKPDALVGKVSAVRSGADLGAPRVDGWWFRLCGAVYGRTRPVRALPHRIWDALRRAWNALPWHRRRTYPVLVEAMAAVVQHDPQARDLALRAADPYALAAVARRHGCAAVLVDALAGAAIIEEDKAQVLRRLLQPAGRNAVVAVFMARSQLASVSGILKRADVPFVLLKGAARLYRNEAGSELHALSDFDILVPDSRINEAIEALRAHGYDERRYAPLRDRYRAVHHHAAPLFPPGPGFAVELHAALAPPGRLSTKLDWEALGAFFDPVEGPAGEVFCLDPAGSALHLAVHAVGQHRLRDSVLLALELRKLLPSQTAHLQRIAAAETSEPVRLGASIGLGARIAGIVWPQTAAQAGYLQWVMKREDVPLYFGQRSQLVEAWYGAGRRWTRLARRLLDPRSGLSDVTPTHAFGRIVGRILASMCAWAYVGLLRSSR